MTSVLKQLVKIALFAALLLLLYHFALKGIDPAAVWENVKRANPLFLLLAVLFMVIKYLMLGLKFRCAAGVLNPDISKSGFLLNEFKLLFMEFAVPVPNSEDVFRLLFLKMKNVTLAKSAGVVLANRVSGAVIIAFLLAALVAYTGSSIIEYDRMYMLLLIGLLLIGLFTHRQWLKLFRRFLKKPSRLARGVDLIISDKVSYRDYTALAGLSFLHYLSAAVVIFFLLRSFEAGLSLGILILIIPVIALSFIIPLSVQGLGLPEATMLFLLTKLHVAGEIASAVSLMHLAIFVLLILSGGVLFFFDKDYKLSLIKDELKKYATLMKTSMPER